MPFAQRMFYGEMPTVDSEKLPAGCGTLSSNTKLLSQTLEPWRAPLQVLAPTKAGSKKTIYRWGQSSATDTGPEKPTSEHRSPRRHRPRCLSIDRETGLSSQEIGAGRCGPTMSVSIRSGQIQLRPPNTSPVAQTTRRECRGQRTLPTHPPAQTESTNQR